MPETSPITLYAFAKPVDRPSHSGYCQKLETYLRFASIPYVQKDTYPHTGPKGRVPYIDDGRGNRVPDSHFIIRHLIKEGIADDLNVKAGLSKAQIAEGNAFRAAFEVMTHAATVYQRWLLPANYPILVKENFGSIPWPIRPILASFFHSRIKKALTAHGVAQHTPEEVESILVQSYSDLEARLQVTQQDGPWFFGKQGPAEIDAVLFGFLSTTVITHSNPFAKNLIMASPVLRGYISNAAKLYFPEYKALISELAAESASIQKVAS